MTCTTPAPRHSSSTYLQPLLTPPRIRDEPSFRTLLLTSTSKHELLLTLWTASYCSTCRAVTPTLKSVIESYPPPPSPSHPSVGFVEVELDAPDVATTLGVEYGIKGVPTLMAFGARKGEPRFSSRADGADTKKLGDKTWVEGWIRERVEEEARSGGGGGGQGLFARLFGGGS
jgi:thiol-disulfide isomerase/thioredoxin